MQGMAEVLGAGDSCWLMGPHRGTAIGLGGHTEAQHGRCGDHATSPPATLLLPPQMTSRGQPAPVYTCLAEPCLLAQGGPASAAAGISHTSRGSRQWMPRSCSPAWGLGFPCLGDPGSPGFLQRPWTCPAQPSALGRAVHSGQNLFLQCVSDRYTLSEDRGGSEGCPGHFLYCPAQQSPHHGKPALPPLGLWNWTPPINLHPQFILWPRSRQIIHISASGW